MCGKKFLVTIDTQRRYRLYIWKTTMMGSYCKCNEPWPGMADIRGGGFQRTLNCE